MELIKQRIQTNQIGRVVTDQFVLEDDCQIPEDKREARRVLCGKGKLSIEEVKRTETYVRVSGKLRYSVLYVTESPDGRLDVAEGERPFEEMVYMEEEGNEYLAKVGNLELTASILHGRKLAVRAIVTLQVHPETRKEEEITSDVDSGKNLYKKKREIELLELHLNKRDICRIKEERTISGTKESIGNLLWTETFLPGVDTKLVEDELVLRGELQVFCIYESQEGKIDWVEMSLPFQCRTDCPGADESMYHHADVKLGEVQMEARMDEDGEMRAIGIEAALELKILVYKEEKMEILEDVYSLDETCIPTLETREYEELLLQNHSRSKVEERLSLPELKDEILQICHSWGSLQVEQVQIVDKGIQVEGILNIGFLYIRGDDEAPFDIWQGMVPFTSLLECENPPRNLLYDVNGSVEQLGISMAGSREVEVRAVLSFHSFMRKPVPLQVITDLTFSPMDETARNAVPGIVGYIVKEGDDLWGLAKRYFTTVQAIAEKNHLPSEQVKEGDKILIFKENPSIL